MRLQIKWAEQINNLGAGKKGGSCMTAVQWLSIKEAGARRLRSITDAVRTDRIPMDAYDRKAAHKVDGLHKIDWDSSNIQQCLSGHVSQS